MYLLMLLATFISAIYGYNLSARADYDRDVAKKKAMGLIYRFMFQEDAASGVLFRINNGEYASTGYGLNWFLPNDLIYADFDNSAVRDTNNKYTTLFFKQNGTVDYFHLRQYENFKDKTVNRNKGVEGKNYMETGRRLFDGSVMMTKVICLDKKLQDPRAKNCTPDYVDPTNPSAGVTGTCCQTSEENYLISYYKIDSRWINRINQGISLDFMKAIAKKNYSDNIGIIHWEGDAWHFQGKISVEEELDETSEDEENSSGGGEGSSGEEEVTPTTKDVEALDKTSWVLPNYIFDRDFFKDKNGNNMCERGCLFRIRGF